MKSRFSILKWLAAYVVIGCVLSVAITVTTSVLYPAFLLTGLSKLPMLHLERSKSFYINLQSGDFVRVFLYNDFVVSAAVLSSSGYGDVSVRHSSCFSDNVLTRAYTQAVFVASQTKLGPRDEPGGILFGFGLPFRSAYFQVSWFDTDNYGYLSGGINLLSNKPLLPSPFNVIIPYTLLWQGLVMNALFWTGASFALHRGIGSLFKRLRRSNVRSPQHAQRDGAVPRV